MFRTYTRHPVSFCTPSPHVVAVKHRVFCLFRTNGLYFVTCIVQRWHPCKGTHCFAIRPPSKVKAIGHALHTMAQRKLQQEMDRTFKKVAEGIAAFESIYEKIQQTPAQAQKEKMEQDLKKEIKKLQRLREQIKNWAAANEVKDKGPLHEQRKLIENQMERFKACEKEMKTKAYSKEGLSAATKLDPKEKEKLELVQFLSTMVEELERQIEQAEAEAELLQAGMKKGKKDTLKADRLADVDHQLDRHKWHQGRLELIMRSLENGNLETDIVSNIQEDIKYYVESNQETDFAEDENIYDDLNLIEEEDQLAANEDKLSSTDAQSVQEESFDEKPPPPPPPPPKKPEARRASSSAKVAPTITHVAPITNGGMKPAPMPAKPVGDLKYASAAAAAAAASPASSNPSGLTPLPPPLGIAPKALAPPTTAAVPAIGTSSTTQGAGRHNSVASSTSASVGDSLKGILEPTTSSPRSTHALPVSAAHPASFSGGSDSTSPLPTSAQPVQIQPSSSLAQSSEQDLETDDAKDVPELEPSANSISNADGTSLDEPLEEDYQLPPGLQDLVSSFDAAKRRAMAPPDMAYVQRLLDTSLQHVPNTMDAEKPRHYVPKNAFPTPAHYPQERLPLLDDPALFEKMDIDALFYVFYYQQGTYQQFLAAKELKKQSWRFHKKYLTWFQRHEEPKQITDDFEQGTYRYFDYESMWIQRRKTNLKYVLFNFFRTNIQV